MQLLEEVAALERSETTRQTLVAAAELFQRAEVRGELAAAIRAKSHEVVAASRLGANQHAVVACAELLELVPRLLALPERDTKTERRLVEALKRGAHSAMDLPEIPLATVRELLASLGRVLASAGVQPVVLWALEARLAFIEDDQAALQSCAARLAPQLGYVSCLTEFSDCPGCVLLQISSYLGPDAPAEALEATLAPALEGRSFPRDVAQASLVASVYGKGPSCDAAQQAAPVHLARAYARAGRLAEARVQAAKAREKSKSAEPWLRLRAELASVEVAVASGDEASARLYVAALAADVGALDDPYDELDATIALHGGYRMLGQEGELAGLHERAVALAARLDARLPSPRHEGLARARLEGARRAQ